MDLIRHKVLDRIRSEIFTCEIPPGAEIRETELAEKYEVSKSPVREALQRLAFEGLVETLPRKGHRVTPISISDASDILEMRETLESAAVKRMIAKCKDAQLGALDRWRDADTSSLEAFAEYNREFHIALADLCGNARLAEDVRRLMHSYDRLCVVSLSQMRDEMGDFGKPLSDHVELIDAIQARDARKAARIVNRHLGASRRKIMKGLSRRPIVE